MISIDEHQVVTRPAAEKGRERERDVLITESPANDAGRFLASAP
jgi:hypothetical protein